MAGTWVATDPVVLTCSNKHKKSAVFRGGNSDDYIQVDALAAARTAANDTVGTITAWIMTGDKTGTYSILGFGDKDVVEFIEFNVEAGKLACRCTDATVVQFVSVTNAAVIEPHKWYHVAVVQKANGTGPQFYVNGVHVASTNSTATDVNEWFVNCDGIDSGRIGAANKAGNDSVTQEFVGAVSDLKYYNTALTAEQIANDAKEQHLSTGCIAWYKFNNDLLDSATGSTTYQGTYVSDCYIDHTYCELTSRLKHQLGALAADIPAIAASNNGETIHAVVINAA